MRYQEIRFGYFLLVIEIFLSSNDFLVPETGDPFSTLTAETFLNYLVQAQVVELLPEVFDMVLLQSDFMLLSLRAAEDARINLS